jgi:hypothetical protein
MSKKEEKLPKKEQNLLFIETQKERKITKVL